MPGRLSRRAEAPGPISRQGADRGGPPDQCELIVKVKTGLAEAIAGQLEEFVQNFPRLQAGERKLLVETLIERVEIGKKRVVALLRPPLACIGYLSPSLAPRVGKPQVPELRIHVRYELGAYYLPSVAEGRAEYAVSAVTPHPLAPGCAGVLA